MDQSDKFSSHWADVKDHQTGRWTGDNKIDDVNVCNMSVNDENTSSDGLGDELNSCIYTFNEIGEIVRVDDGCVNERDQLNDNYDAVDENLNDNPFEVDYDHVDYVSSDEEFYANETEFSQQTVTATDSSAKSMHENAYNLIGAANRPLDSFDIEKHNEQIEPTIALNPDQNLLPESSDHIISIESSESDVDSVVMIDLTSDHDEIGVEIPQSDENPDGEGDQEQPTKRKVKYLQIPAKRRRKQNSVNRSKCSNKKHKCGSCTYSTSIKAHFIRHSRTHYHEKSFKCKICSKRFVRSDALVRHMKIHKQNSIAFNCSRCCRKFTREKPWRSHEYKCKNGLRQYECYLCKEIVFNKNHLLNHLRLHTGKRDHCEICQKQFASKTGLTNHLKKHAELFPYHCSTCRQVFARRAKWKLHEKRCKLKQYNCNVCNRVFVNKSHMIYHMQRHAGKTFRCANCSKQFESTMGLKFHKCF